MVPVRTRHCRLLHHIADCLSEIQSFHVFTQADGPQLQICISPLLLPPTSLPCAHCLLFHPCRSLLFQGYFSVVGSNRWYSIALSFAFGALADVQHKGSTPTKLNAFIRLRAVAHNWHGAQIVSTVTTSLEKAVVAKTGLLNPLGRLDVYRTSLQPFTPALCPSLGQLLEIRCFI